MSRPVTRLIGGVFAGMVVVLAACGDNAPEDREAAESNVREAATTVRQEAREAWAVVSTEGERLIDRIQTANDPGAKQELLDRCRDAQERLRKAGDSNADRVNELCDDIRDADANNRSTWDEIEQRFKDLNARLRG